MTILTAPVYTEEAHNYATEDKRYTSATHVDGIRDLFIGPEN